MTQRALHVGTLPESPLAANARFFAQHLEDARALISDQQVQALAIVMPVAGRDHDDWRRALARDLARDFSPIRVNVVGAEQSERCEAMLTYLMNAPGVTGQYLAAHD
ncbi:MAG: Rossmann fold domain-containing protein [Erythrobacter sp.]